MNSETGRSFDDSFDLARLCSIYLRDKNDEHNARDIIIRVLDVWDKVEPSTYSIWNDLTEVAGLYPYVENDKLTGSSLIRYEYHKSLYLENVYFHQEQQIISTQLLSKNSVVISAPTSFGKSLLIEEIIAAKIYSNIVIIQPTLALLDETRKKLKKYRDKYKIIVSTNQKPSSSSGNVFLFTGERVVEYQDFENVDFFVIDEFYKLSLGRDDERAIVLNHAFYKLLKYTKKFYLLGPMIKRIPRDFKERIEFYWTHTTFSTVAIDEIPLFPRGKKLSKEEKPRILFELLDIIKEPTLIYCSSPSKATSLTVDYTNYLTSRSKNPERNHTKNNREIIEWIEENIHPKWILTKALEEGIAFHHGAIPRHLGSSIVDAFNTGNVRILFCTTTLIEGVNTTAKNVILFDKLKGRKQIDYFDYRNIAGRSGRMGRYYLGRVYRLEDEPLQLELEVDIPIISQEDAPPELLIQLDEEDLSETSKEKLKDLRDLNPDLLKVIKNNSGLPIEGQLNIVQTIEKNLRYFHALLNWTNIPNFDQLEATFNLAWANLFKPKENKGGVHTAKQLTYYTMRYYEFKSIAKLIIEQVNSDYYKRQYEDTSERVNIVVYSILNVSRHWFEYKLPKWLNAVSNLQEYVFFKNNLPFGNYYFFSSQIEKGFLHSNLASLLENDVPLSAIRKLRKYVDEDLGVDEIVEWIAKAPLKELGLLDYEITKLRSIL